MRRGLGVLVMALLLVLGAGCGGGSDAHRGLGAESLALSYLPRDTVAAVVVQTDPEAGQVKAALDLVGRFPGADVALERAKRAVASGGADFQRDVRPLLGAPVAVGVVDAAAAHFVLAWRTADARVLSRVTATAATSLGHYEGAQLYRNGSTVSAVAGPVLVASDREALVRAALRRHHDGSGLSAGALRAAGPRDALVRGAGNLSALLARPAVHRARRVPWVRALKRYGFAVTAGDSGVGVELRADTSGGGLSGDDVPLATGPAAPKLADAQGLAVGLRDPAHVFAFALRAAGAVDPAGTTRFRAALDALKGLANVDVRREVIGQLDSDATLITDLGEVVAVRATARHPAVLAGALARLERLVPAALGGGGVRQATVSRAGRGVWSVSTLGAPVGAYGVVGDQFVAGNVSVAELRTLAARPAAVPDGAGGALAVRLPAALTGRLLSARLGIPPPLAGLALRALGDLHGWVRATPSGLRGEFRQDVH